MGPRVGLDSFGKSHPPPGFDSRTVQPVANRCAIQAHGQDKFAVFMKHGSVLGMIVLGLLQASTK